MGAISVWKLLFVVVIIVLIFGTKKLRNLGSDLGSAIKGFKKAMDDHSDNTHSTAEKDADADADFQPGSLTDKPQPTAVKKEAPRHDK